jgi:outer membrane protein insertion porin family
MASNVRPRWRYRQLPWALALGWWLWPWPGAGGSPALAAAAAPPALPELDSHAGRPLTAVELVADAPLAERAELERLLAVGPGDRLDPVALRSTLRNLWATGRFSGIEAWASPTRAPARADGEASAAEPGIELRILLSLAVRVDAVVLSGELGLREASLRAAVAQHPGEPLIEDRVVRGVFRLQDLLASQGYRDARVRVDVDVDEARRSARVEYQVAAGPRYRVGEIAFAGNLGPLAAGDLLRALRARVGRPYVASEVRADADRLRAELIARGFRKATVEEPRVEADAARQEVVVTLPLEVGPEVSFTLHGADEKALARQGLLPFLGSEGYDEALVLQAVERLREHYQRKGFYRVAVTTEERAEPGRLHLDLRIETGPELVLEEILFEGNQTVDEKTLRRLMATSERRTLVPGSGRLVDATLAADLTNIRGYYALRGFRDTAVGPPRVATRAEFVAEGREIPRDQELVPFLAAAPAADGSGLVLVVPIREGTLRTVGTLALEGARAVPREVLLEGLSLASGGPYHPRLLDESLALLRKRYADRGFDEAQVSASTTWNAAGDQVAVVFHVLEGVQAVADRVVVRGNERTRTDVILRATAVRPGEPLHPERVLGIQRRLYDLGVFSRVDVELLRDAPFTAGRDVVVRVEEGRSRRLSYGLGYDSEDGARGLLLLSQGNLFGRAMLGQLDLRLGQRTSSARLSFRQPTLGDWPVPISYSVYYQDEDSSRFVGRIRGTRVEATRLFRPLRLDLLYNYRIVDGAAQAGNEDDRTLSNVAISSLTPSLFVDRRDDPVDPRRGWSSLLQLEYAFPALSADEEFGKLFLQQTGHLSLPWPGHVLAASARVGAIEDLSGDTGSAGGALPFNPIPPVERFFAGGRSTHRAFPRDDLGVPGQTLDGRQGVGGNGLLLANLDWRFPITGSFGGVVFADWGNVWHDWRDIDPAEGRLGAGFGLRYLSPVGPLRVEIGWNLDRQGRESPFAVFVSLGNPF